VPRASSAARPKRKSTRKGPELPGERSVPAAVDDNIATIAELEQQWLRERKVGEHLGDAVARALGTLPMLVFHLVWFTGWFVVNLGWIPGIEPFDPYPFGFLTLFVSLEAIFLSLFLLISQNRLQHQADKRMHLDMQINLLAEAEVTQVLKLLQRIGHKLGVDGMNEADLQDFARPTDVRKVVEAVENTLPESAPSEGERQPSPRR
jgi:uncharacterized membrane protein